jgi:hypothetical protein
MAIQTKRFNWVQRPSAWEYAQAWRSHRSSMVQRFLDDGASAASAFLSAQQNLSMGLATLAAQASIQRAQDAIRATAQQFTDAKNQINLLA